MAKEIAVENDRISNLQGLVTLTLNRVKLHTVMHHSLTSTYTPNFIEIEETFWGRTYVRMYARTYICMHVHMYTWTDGHLRPALVCRL